MPIRRWALTTILTSMAIGVFAADASAQIVGKSRPGAPAFSIGLVEGLQDENDTSLSLAQLAAESSLWTPTCEPPGPTRGLWGDGPPSAPGCSWQECVMGFRDGLGWVFTRPTCIRGVYAASDASAWDWVTQWMPRLGATSSGPSAMCTGTTATTIKSE